MASKLRGKKPDERPQRLKLLLSGPAGVGKTMASIQMPKPYLIDTESGSVHYGDTIEASGGAVFESSSVDDIIQEVRNLMTEQHDYRTLVIDPVTTVFYEAVDEGERTVGTEFGKHYAYANKKFKRLCGLLTAIDMNVIITAHEKKEYGDDMKVIGNTFDGAKKLDYIFDLWLQLSRERGKPERFATVMKTRLTEFPDGSKFGWTYEELVKRFGAERLEEGTKTIDLANDARVKQFKAMYSRLTEAEVKAMKLDKAFAKYGEPEDWTAEQIDKAIGMIEEATKVAA